MNSRQVLTAWGLALFGNVLFFSAAHHAFKSRWTQQWDQPIAVVGTSLVGYGLPDGHSIKGSLLADGRKHVRVGLGNPTELEILTVANQAMAQNPQLLFLEAYPFIRSFNTEVDRESGCSLPQQMKSVINNAVNSFFGSAQSSALIIMGKNVYTRGMRDEPTELQLGKHQNSSPSTSHYPLSPRPVACPEQLQKLLVTASSKNTQVVLLLPPRSMYAEKFAGLGSSRALDLQAKKMAQAYRLELFSPIGPWPNSLFVDSAHMNLKGRERFLRELQNWWHSRK